MVRERNFLVSNNIFAFSNIIFELIELTAKIFFNNISLGVEMVINYNIITDDDILLYREERERGGKSKNLKSKSNSHHQ